jgi:hypothetical protein
MVEIAVESCDGTFCPFPIALHEVARSRSAPISGHVRPLAPILAPVPMGSISIRWRISVLGALIIDVPRRALIVWRVSVRDAVGWQPHEERQFSWRSGRAPAHLRNGWRCPKRAPTPMARFPALGTTRACLSRAFPHADRIWSMSRLRKRVGDHTLSAPGDGAPPQNVEPPQKSPPPQNPEPLFRERASLGEGRARNRFGAHQFRLVRSSLGGHPLVRCVKHGPDRRISSAPTLSIGATPHP